MTDDVRTQSPSVAIVIPSYRRADLLVRTLESMAEAVWPQGFEVVRVVENGPPSGIESAVRPFDKRLPIIYQNEATLGSSAARNAGLARCDQDIVIFFDNDIRLERDSLLAYRQAFDQYGTSAFYGGPVLADYVMPPPKWLREFLPWSATGIEFGAHDRWLEEPVFIGASMAFPRKCLLELGGFDAIGATGKRGGVGEEIRLQQRLLDAGYKGRYVAGARVWHYVPPEDCSPQWALGRAFRHGMTDSLEARLRGRRRGVRLWMIRHAAGLEMRTLLARMRRRPLEERFALEWKRAHFRGFLAGCHDGKNSGEKV